MTQPDYERAMQYALTRLLADLPAYLTYHCVEHTRDSVVPAAERLAAAEGVDGDALLLLRTAAWYHDIGFVAQHVDHEAIGVRIAATVLPGFGYTRAQLATIAGIIMATKLPQAPQTLLEALLADADLDVLGRENFFSRNQDLRNELEALGSKMSDEQWYSTQLQFLQTHRYWTASASALRDAGKERNCVVLQGLLARAHSTNEITN